MLKIFTPYFTSLNKSNRPIWYKLVNVSGEYIYRDDLQPTAYNRICSEAITQSLKSYLIIMAVITLSFIVAALGPLHSFITDWSLFTLYEVRLPFVIRIWSLLSMWFGNFSYPYWLVWECSLIEGVQCIINDTITVSSQVNSLEFAELSEVLEN